VSSYTIDITVEDRANAPGIPSMAWLGDIVGDALEHSLGLTPEDYTIEVTGPPELRIGVLMR
jgi:hypothetical protein